MATIDAEDLASAIHDIRGLFCQIRDKLERGSGAFAAMKDIQEIISSTCRGHTLPFDNDSTGLLNELDRTMDDDSFIIELTNALRSKSGQCRCQLLATMANKLANDVVGCKRKQSKLTDTIERLCEQGADVCAVKAQASAKRRVDEASKNRIAKIGAVVAKYLAQRKENIGRQLESDKKLASALLAAGVKIDREELLRHNIIPIVDAMRYNDDRITGGNKPK